MTVTPAVPLSSSHATTCRMAEEQDRLKGFLGTANEMTSIAEVIAPATVAWVRSLSDTEIIPMGEKALGDIADNILVLDEIRQRFRKGLPILGYINWKEFVERNSKYSIRTIQRRLNEVNGKDETKVNDRFKTIEADTDETTSGRKTWTEEQVFDWLKEKHPAVYAHYEAKGFPRWIPLPPSIEIADKDGCDYCAFHSSSRSCPVHGWPDKGVPSAFRQPANDYKTTAPSNLVAHINENRHDVYIGRRVVRGGHNIPASIWGNHAHLPLDKYEEYVRSSPELMQQLPSLKGKVLGCWHTVAERGKGLVCHGDVLLKLIDEFTAAPAVEDDPELDALLAPLTPEELESDQKFKSTLEAPETETPEPKESDLTRLRQLFKGTGLELTKSDHGSKYRLDKLTAAQVREIATLLVSE